MLGDVVQLEPYAEPMEHAGELATIAPTNPPIMIPGINADGSYYPIEKIEAHINGQHHLAVSAFVFDSSEMLIQRRAESKYHCGGQWANTCCTHPHWEEDPNAAVSRRLMEELGFQVPMEERLIVEYSADVGNGLWEKERVHMFRAGVSKDEIELNLNPDEVSATRWVDAQTLRAEIEANPEQFTPWFRIYLNRYPTLDF